MKHSELPWKISTCSNYVDGHVQIFAKERYEVARLKNGNLINNGSTGTGTINDCSAVTEANAQFIVKACNNHYKLLEALKEMYDTSCANATSTPSKKAFLKAQQAIKEAE